MTKPTTPEPTPAATEPPIRPAPFAFIDGVLVARDPAEPEVQRVPQPDALRPAKP